MQWGFNAWQAKPLFQSGAKVGTRAGADGQLAAKCRWSRRAISRSPCPAGLSSGPIKTQIRYKGPMMAPIAKGQHVADLVITTGDTPPQVVPLVAGEDVGKAGFFGRVWLGLKQLVRNGVSGADGSSPRRRGGGRQVDPGQGARRGADARAASTCSSPASPAEATGAEADPRAAAERERGALGRRGRSLAVRRRPRRSCRRRRSGPRSRRGHWVLATASSTARSPIRAAPAGSASKPCARSTRSASATAFPIGPWCCPR